MTESGLGQRLPLSLQNEASFPFLSESEKLHKISGK